MDPFAAPLLSAQSSDERRLAWSAFLERYSGLLYHVVRSLDREADRSGDCFVFVCEQLSINNFCRLRKFQPSGRANFATWLCAVARNLCLDWHRKQHGRHRVFGSIAQRSAVDQLLFEFLFRRRWSAEEARQELSRRGFELGFADIEERILQLRRRMTSRQLWLLSCGTPVTDSIDAGEEGMDSPEPADPSPGPEALASLHETHAQVSAALASLSDSDRLLIRLRYQEGLTLQEVARLVGLKDAQTADRRLRDVIDYLRQILGVKGILRGKPKPTSV